MPKTTIRDAITTVLREANGSPMGAKEIYEAILSRELYEFNAKDPLNIVRNQLRRHCSNIECTTSARIRCFKMTDSGVFVLDNT